MRSCRGTQRKTWRKVLSELLLQLNIDSQEILAKEYNVNFVLRDSRRSIEGWRI